MQKSVPPSLLYETIKNMSAMIKMEKMVTINIELHTNLQCILVWNSKRPLYGGYDDATQLVSAYR